MVPHGTYGLQGPLPPQWSTWAEVEDVDLDDNLLTGTLPPQWSTWERLRKMYVGGGGGQGPPWARGGGGTPLDGRRRCLRGMGLGGTGRVVLIPWV